MSIPQNRRLRILEVGAGRGGTSQHVLPLCDQDNTDYIYTDISAGFFDQASRDFTDYSFVQYQSLNLEESPGEQGFADLQYDVVIAANVLHATCDMRQTLTHISRLMVPGVIYYYSRGLNDPFLQI